MTEPNAFDMHTAFIRRTQQDMKAFLEAFATRLEQSLPGKVEVRRKKDSLFSSARHVSGITIHAEANLYVLETADTNLSLSRRNEVRGIVLKTEEMPLPDWLDSLNRDIVAMSKNSVDSLGVLHDFLMN